MPQLDLFMFASLVYPTIIFFLSFFIFSQLLILVIVSQRYVFRYVLDVFNPFRATFAHVYSYARLRSFFFREFFIYSVGHRLLV